MLSDRPTLKDVARRAGVHVSTASRALNPATSSVVNTETLARVAAAADALGYRPHPLARGLRTNQTMSVGMVIPDVENPLFGPIVAGAESVVMGSMLAGCEECPGELIFVNFYVVVNRIWRADFAEAKRLAAGLERRTDFLVGLATAAVLFLGDRPTTVVGRREAFLGSVVTLVDADQLIVNVLQDKQLL